MNMTSAAQININEVSAEFILNQPRCLKITIFYNFVSKIVFNVRFFTILENLTFKNAFSIHTKHTLCQNRNFITHKTDKNTPKKHICKFYMILHSTQTPLKQKNHFKLTSIPVQFDRTILLGENYLPTRNTPTP